MCKRNVTSRGSPITPARDGARQQRLPGREPELSTEQVHDAGCGRGGVHGARLGEIASERLLAQHVLAGRHRFQHERRSACAVASQR